MSQQIEKNFRSMTDSELQQNSEKITGIIERLENNHFKWYIIQVSIVAFTITIFTFAFDSFQGLGVLNRILICIFFGIVVNFLSFVSMYNCFKYLRMGRSFRKMEKKMRENNKKPSYNGRDTKVKLELNFVFGTSVFFVLTVFLLSVFIPIFHEVNL